MIILFFFLIGGVAGAVCRTLLQQSARQISAQVYANYCEIFPENPPHFQPEKSSLTAIKCGAFWLYFGVSGLFWAANACFWTEPITALFYASYGTLLGLISKIDWHYRLISLTHCWQLGALGLLGVYFQLIDLSLAQSLQSLFVVFVIFWAIFHLARFYYQQEAFGRGDYWLISALAVLHSWQELPLFIFLSCFSAVLFYGCSKWWAGRFSSQKISQNAPHFLPFAPFLALGQVVSLALNVLG
ncbi:hypothetical protein A4G18_06875 [Pasteurellaceae bacterium Pebbles2]|nr:hypothetical protein [Pasteurellaceae bacterium Pebbles2]